MRSSRRGQIAIGFVVILSIILFLVMMTVNIGQMAQVRVETSNAADAGALAAASWMASGQNEAAMIAGKSYDAMAMVQAIYLVPFCPGPASSQYANQLWASLSSTSMLNMPGPVVAQGPIWYWHEVADAVMRSAMDVGRREYLTAAFNNMMIRHNNTIEGVFGDGGLGINPYGDLSGRLKDFQDLMYDDRGAPGIGGVNWNNGLPMDHPLNLTHWADFHMDGYPQQPPTLHVVNLRATYYQYRPKEVLPIFPAPIFDCEFVGRGITDTINTGPLVTLANVTLPDNPLRVIASTGKKAWDLNLGRIIPRIGHSMPSMDIQVGECQEHVCGMDVRQTPEVEVWPVGITNGEGDVTVTVAHDVQTGNGLMGSFFGPVPVWERRFQKVASRARAHYKQASGGFFVVPDAAAYLEDGAE